MLWIYSSSIKRTLYLNIPQSNFPTLIQLFPIPSLEYLWNILELQTISSYLQLFFKPYIINSIVPSVNTNRNNGQNNFSFLPEFFNFISVVFLDMSHETESIIVIGNMLNINTEKKSREMVKSYMAHMWGYINLNVSQNEEVWIYSLIHTWYKYALQYFLSLLRRMSYSLKINKIVHILIQLFLVPYLSSPYIRSSMQSQNENSIWLINMFNGWHYPFDYLYNLILMFY